MRYDPMHNLFLTHPVFLEHCYLDHPENALRLQAIIDAFNENPDKYIMTTTIERNATIEELALVHGKEYIDHILSFKGKEVYLDQETVLTKRSVEAALCAVGLGMELVEQIITGKVSNGFAFLRPPGHHARPMLAMGFCIFNNIAIAASKALAMGVKRILIFDFDVHHGNGTQETFYEDDRVMFIDIHQNNLFPINSGTLQETGKGKGKGYTVNIPLPEGCQDHDYLNVIDTIVTPLTLDYQPELILVSAGFDAHKSDPLAFMKLTTQGYADITAKICSLAKQVGHEKIAFFLEGGYNPYFLAKNVMACVENLTSVNTRHLDKYPASNTYVDHLIKTYYAFHLNHS